MNKTLIAAALSLCLGTGVFAAETELETDEQKLSYSLGLMIGERVLKRYGDVDYDLMLEAMKAQHKGEDTKMSMEEAGASLEAFEKAANEKKVEISQAAGKVYLEENAAREGVTVTESGLHWEVITEGEGDKPGLEDTVSVHYVGTLMDGTEFDSSVARGEPASFPLKGVIPGWTEGVQLMNVGSKYRFVIPSELAYGDKGAGEKIGPGETLVFEVELLEIKQ